MSEIRKFRSGMSARGNSMGEGPSQAEDDDDPGSPILNYITREYELLKRVLGHLTLKELNVAAQVCRAWESAVTIVKKNRVQPHWFLWSPKLGDLEMDELPQKLFDRHVFSDPQLCVCFMTEETCKINIECQRSNIPCPLGSRSRCPLNHRVVHYLRAQLSSSCPCLLAEGVGIVGTTHDLSQTEEIEEKRLGYSGLLLPKIPGVIVTMFQFEKVASLRSLFANLQEMEELIGLPTDGTPIRCLLLFARQGYSTVITHLVSVLQSRQREKIAIGGGIFKSLNLCNVESQAYKLRGISLVGIAFSGEKVTANSTILTSEVTDREQMDEAMRELRACAQPTKTSLGFMFSCLGRGTNWYHDENVESSSYRSYFPTTPLLGYFGTGEIGYKNLPALDSGERTTPLKKPRKESHPNPPLFHTYSTVIVNLYIEDQRTSSV